MKKEEKERKFHEALLKVLYPPPSPPPYDNVFPLNLRTFFIQLYYIFFIIYICNVRNTGGRGKKRRPNRSEFNRVLEWSSRCLWKVPNEVVNVNFYFCLIFYFSFNVEEEIDNEEQPASNTEDNSSDGKMTRAQRKRLRKRKLKEAATHRRKIIGPLLPPGSNDCIDQSNGSVEDMSNVADGVRQNNDVSVSGEIQRSLL